MVRTLTIRTLTIRTLRGFHYSHRKTQSAMRDGAAQNHRDYAMIGLRVVMVVQVCIRGGDIQEWHDTVRNPERRACTSPTDKGEEAGLRVVKECAR